MPNANDFNFDGSVIALGATDLGTLRSIDYSETGAQVQVTGSSDAIHTYRAGIPDPTITVSIVGGLNPLVLIGTQGALTATWQDATTEGSIDPVLCVDRAQTGSMDTEITSTYIFKPAQADAV